MIKLSNNAIDVLSRYIKYTSLPVRAVRIGVSESGLSGSRFNLKFVESEKADDTVSDYGSFKLLVDQRDLPLVKGLEIDFVNHSEKAGFKFLVPENVANAA